MTKEFTSAISTYSAVHTTGKTNAGGCQDGLDNRRYLRPFVVTREDPIIPQAVTAVLTAPRVFCQRRVSVPLLAAVMASAKVWLPPGGVPV